jgi:hypothetical protein
LLDFAFDVGGIYAEYMWFMSFQFIQQQQRDIHLPLLF